MLLRAKKMKLDMSESDPGFTKITNSKCKVWIRERGVSEYHPNYHYSGVHCGESAIFCAYKKYLYKYCSICGTITKNGKPFSRPFLLHMEVLYTIAEDVFIGVIDNLYYVIMADKGYRIIKYHLKSYEPFYHKGRLISLPLNRIVYHFDDNVILRNKLYRFWSYADREDFYYSNFIAPWKVEVRPAETYLVIYYALRKKYKLPRPLCNAIIEEGWVLLSMG